MRRPSDPTYAQLAARIPARVHHAVKLAALAAEVTVQDWIADALARHLERCRHGTGGDKNAPGNASTTIRRLAEP